MGSRANAILWCGTKEVDEGDLVDALLGVGEEWPDEPVERKWFEVRLQEPVRELSERFGVRTPWFELVNLPHEVTEEYAFAVKGTVHEADWDGSTRQGWILDEFATSPNNSLLVNRLAQKLGFPGVVTWRLGAYYG